MSKQRNKRNTRRGRAKRWELWICVRGAVVWRLRGGGESCVWVANTFSGEWIVRSDPPSGTIIAYNPNRAAAMRAAEHLARGR